MFVATVKNLDLVLYPIKRFLLEDDIRCMLQEDNGGSMKPGWGGGRQKMKRINRKLLKS